MKHDMTKAREMLKDGSTYLEIFRAIIDALDPQPEVFDWAKVRPGMAVKMRIGDREEIVWIVGRHFDMEGTFVVCNSSEMDCSDQLHFADVKAHHLTRTPEHDKAQP